MNKELLLEQQPNSKLKADVFPSASLAQNPLLAVRCICKLIDITDEDAVNAAAIAKIGNNPTIERFGGRDNGSVTIKDGLLERSIRIYFSGSNTKVLDKGFEVIEYCFDVYDYLRSLGYVWH